MILMAGLLLLGATVMPPSMQVAGSEAQDMLDELGPYSPIESTLQDADEALLIASSYSCSSAPRSAVDAYQRAREKYDRLESEAEAVLGRPLKMAVMVNSCAYFRPGKFYPNLTRAEWHLRRAATLIKNEGRE